jgi:flagellar capping protein FliD
MKFKIQVTKTIILKEEIEVYCDDENMLDDTLDGINGSKLEGTDDLIFMLNKTDGISVVEYTEDGSGEVEISIDDFYKV